MDNRTTSAMHRISDLKAGQPSVTIAEILMMDNNNKSIFYVTKKIHILYNTQNGGSGFQVFVRPCIGA